MSAAAEGRPLRIIGDPGTIRDYVYVEDVVDCMHRLLLADRRELLARWGNPLVLNIGSGKPTSLAQLSDVVRVVLDRDLTFEQLPSRQVDRARVWLNVDRARSALDWQPRTPLLDGVTAMWHARPGAPRVLGSWP